MLQFVLFVLVIQGGARVHCLVMMIMMLFTFIAVVVVVMVVVGHFAFVFDLFFLLRIVPIFGSSKELNNSCRTKRRK